LRLHVSRSESRTVIRVLKRRGGALPAPVTLDLHPWIRFPTRSAGSGAADMHRVAPVFNDTFPVAGALNDTLHVAKTF
jgi:hypothetical protein